MYRIATLALVAACLSTPAGAADLYPWRDHATPFAFRFGNHIDTHQQTRLMRGGSLHGFFYVRYTGLVTKDRYPVATHADCNAVPDCTVGWTLKGRPASATFLYEPMHDHPVFLVARPDIPQPGGYAHYHWLGAMMPMPRQTVDGYLLELTAVDRFCFIHHGAEAATASRPCRDNGGVAVEPGLDIATHLNIVTGAPPGM
jgi:hypothetical protein